jgi:predicted O-methyltransferase YrrM
MTLDTLKTEWVDTPEYHQHINELFSQLVDKDDRLKEHRDFVQNYVWGFGERSFWWMWKLLCDVLPPNFTFLEIGCFKGATLSVIKLLRADARVIGITPLDSTGIDWEDDYRQRIHDIHDKFNDRQYPEIIHGRSDDKGIIAYAQTRSYNVIYIDGGHAKEDIDNDMDNYAPGVEKGGFLVIDDACCDMKMPWGYFQGIQPVTDGVLEYMSKYGSEWEFIGNVVHLRVYKRI